MAREKARMTRIGLINPDGVARPPVDDHASPILMRGVARFAVDAIYGLGDPSERQVEGYEAAFGTLEAGEDDTTSLELGVELGDLLPNIELCHDMRYDITIDAGKPPESIYVSNGMVRIYTVVDGVRQEIIGNAAFLMPLLSSIPQQGSVSSRLGELGLDPYSEFMRTFVVWRTTIHGKDPYLAMEDYILSRLRRLSELVNRLILANMVVHDGFPFTTLPRYDVRSFKIVYFALYGRDPHLIHCDRLSPNLLMVNRNPGRLDDVRVTKLKGILAGNQEVIREIELLYEAKVWLDRGVREHSLLQLVVAGEIATARAVRGLLEHRGVSKKVLEEQYRTRLEHEHRLHILLVALAPDDLKPEAAVLAMLRKGAKWRNEFMHEAKHPPSAKDLYELFNATRSYLELLRQIDERQKTTPAAP